MPKGFEYDEIAETVFAPIYPDIARAMLERTGVRSGRLLDIGCGGGHVGLEVLRQGQFSSAVFADKNEEALALVGQRLEERGLAGMARTSLQDVCALDLPDESFDLIVSRGSMPFWEDQRAAFSNLYRVLAPGGFGYVGGGLGGAQHVKRVREAFAARRGTSGEFKCFDRSQSKALDDDAYRSLFAELGGEVGIIANPDEGHWIIFGKPVS